MFQSFKIRRAVRAKIERHPADTFPPHHHPCTAADCTYANPPSRTAGVFRCRGAPSGPFTCTGLYRVSAKKAAANVAWWEARRVSRLRRAEWEAARAARGKDAVRGVRRAMTALWEEDMRAWGREMEGREQYAREKAARRARAAEGVDRPRAPTPDQAREWHGLEGAPMSPRTTSPPGPRARSPAICEERSVALLQRQLPTSRPGRPAPSARRWVVHND
ncbi:hypothetical protein HDZ31DRAFT_65336 [Schizophyllum fasciatum]